mgnify:CR=1 FL=1
MKKVLVFLMMAIMACSMLLTGCGGEEKKAADSAKVLRVGTELYSHRLNFLRKAARI